MQQPSIGGRQTVASRIFVVIVTYNAEKWLDKCLGTLQDSEIPLNIVVVDNASTDGTPDIIKKDWPGVELIEPGQNLGFGRANNIGIKRALEKGFDHIYLLNQDAWIAPDDILRLAELQSRNPQYGVLSPIQMRADGQSPDANFDICCEESNCPGYRKDTISGRHKIIYEIKKVMAAHWLVSSTAIELIGGFAPIFSHYGEDYNFLDRLRYHGLKAGICPEIHAIHDRETRKIGNIAAEMKKTVNSIFLPLACDINRPVIDALQKALRATARNALRQAKSFKSLRPLASVFIASGKIGPVLATRRETKVPGMRYL